MKKLSLPLWILIGLIFGIVVGILIPETFAIKWIKPFGDLFIRLIKMIIVPLVFSSLVVGASSIGDLKSLGRIGGKTVIYYLITTALAVTISLILALLIQPGLGIKLLSNVEYKGSDIPAVSETLLNIIPDNPQLSLVEGNMLQIIIFALFFGIGITLVGEKAMPVRSLCEGIAEIMYKLTGIIMLYAPIGVFALIVPVVASQGLDVILPLIKIIIVVYLACIIHMLIVYSGAVSMLGKVNPLFFFKSIYPAQLIAFSSCSSAATLPVNINCCEKQLGISNKVASFVLTLGSTINMDGSAIYQGAAAVFIAQAYGLNLSTSQLIMIVVVATLSSIGAAGVPGAGLIMLTMVLTSVGLPLEGVALVAGIDRILDMARTPLNITGDATAAVVIARSENEISI